MREKPKTTNHWTISGQWRSLISSTSIFDRIGLILLVGLGLRPILDPDFGWHLRSGTDFLHNWAIPKADPYSHTLPDWPWVNHEWLMDSLAALIHNVFGPLALIILFALLIASIFMLSASTEKVKLPYKILAALIGLLAALPILGVRMQMITLLGMAWLLWTLSQYRRGDIKQLWWVPPAFLLWANLHGGFLMGLVILGVFWLSEGAKHLLRYWRPVWYKRLRITELTLTSKQLRHLFSIGVLSGLATLINPYGWGLYSDFYKLFTNPFAIQHIGEWQPVSLSNIIALNFTLYLILFVIILLLTYRKVEPTRWVISGLFLGLSFLYWRNLPFFVIMSVGFLAEILQQHTHLVINRLSNNRWVLAIAGLIAIIIIGQRVSDIRVGAADENQHLRESGYPVDAVQWAKGHPDEVGTIMFNEYDWGGFLVWQFPEQKVFVDGRMPYWKMGDRFPFFDEQYAISAQKGAIETLEARYGVDWMLLKPDRPLAIALLGQTNWQETYRDDYAVIYRKIGK